MSNHVVNPSQHQQTETLHMFPIELYDEIISYLWNDFPSLKACALANRILTAPSQKRLFYCIGLASGATFPTSFSGYEFQGTSSSFYKLLARSPHIAGYVQALHILAADIPWDFNPQLSHVTPRSLRLGNEHDIDIKTYKSMNGEEILNLDEPMMPIEKKVYNWLTTDRFFPLFAPTLCNLKALHITHSGWQHLTYRSLFAFLHIIRLPSLICLQINSFHYPQSIFDVSLGLNIKHLLLYAHGNSVQLPFRMEYPRLEPVYLETFSTKISQNLDILPATSRIRISRLRKLVIELFSIHPTAIQTLLQQCHNTLEDFEFRTCRIMASWLSSKLHTLQISLNGLTALKRITISLNIVIRYRHQPFPWLSNLLRSAYSTSVAQRLDEVTIKISYIHFSPELIAFHVDPIHWKPLLDVLSEDELKNLQTLNIFIDSRVAGLATEVVKMLNGCEEMEKLRARPGLILNMRASDYSVPSVGDVRWDTCNWTKWKDPNEQ